MAVYGWMMACLAVLIGCPAFAQGIDLIGDGGAWSAGTDSAGATMTLAPTGEAKLACKVESDGTKEHYPKLRQAWTEPQDWQPYMRLRTRLRVTCDDKSVTQKNITFVFYDDKTRREDLADRPMTQQCIAHAVPVGKWVDYSDWLVNLQRSTIRQLHLYIYDVPPSKAHTYTWEFARLELEGVGEHAVAFDTEVYAKEKIQGARGKPVGKVTTADGLELSLGSAGEVSQVAVDQTPAGAAGTQPSGLLVRDAATEEPPVMVGGRIEARGKELHQTGKVEKLGLSVDATYKTAGPYLEVSGTVSDTLGKDRAVTVYLAVPLADAPWQWWDSVSVSRTKADGMAELSYLEIGVEYGQNGAHSKYPLGAVTWPGRAGLSLAVRMDEPVVHRLAYNPELKLFYVAVDFGLVPEKTVDGRSLSQAPFRFLVYRHGPAWGFRSALQRYYGFFPDFFTKRATREGGWFVWGDVSKMEGALEAGFEFHWGPGGADAVKWDNAHNVLALLYIEAEFFQQTLGDFDHSPTGDEAIDRLKKLASGDEPELAKMMKLSYSGGYVPGSWVKEHSYPDALLTIARAATASVEQGSDGRPYTMIGEMPWMGESKWGCIFPCNLDPTIPNGKGWFNSRIYLDYNLKEVEPAGARYDGIGLDSLGGYGQHSRVNYRREHFRYGTSPLCFAAVDHAPVKVAAFTTVEWVRQLAEEMHKRGLVLMTNCSWGMTPAWLTFGGPYLDIFGAEATQFADPDYIRAIAYRKPCTDLPYNPRPDWEVAWHILHDIYPGHGNKVEVMRLYAALLRDLAAAGWEPITQARVEPATVRLERYGSGATVYLVAHNPAKEPVEATIQVDGKALGWKQFTAAMADTQQTLPVTGDGVPVHLDPQGTVAVRLSGG